MICYESVVPLENLAFVWAANRLLSSNFKRSNGDPKQGFDSSTFFNHK
jgi:hypothetical protein